MHLVRSLKVVAFGFLSCASITQVLLLEGFREDVASGVDTVPSVAASQEIVLTSLALAAAIITLALFILLTPNRNLKGN